MKTAWILILLAVASVASAEMYTWKDRSGTSFYTNSLDEIPAKYRRKARVYDVATGKKGGLATAQTVAPAPPQHVDTPAQHAATPPEPVAAPAPASAPVAAGINGINGIATTPVSPPAGEPVVGTPPPRSGGTLAERRARRRQIVGAPLEQ